MVRQKKARAATLSVVRIGPAICRDKRGLAECAAKAGEEQNKTDNENQELAHGISRVMGYLAKMGM